MIPRPGEGVYCVKVGGGNSHHLGMVDEVGLHGRRRELDVDLVVLEAADA